MGVTTVLEHYENFIVTANIGGKFDMKGLQNPLVLAFYFTPHGERIVRLIILRNRYDMIASERQSQVISDLHSFIPRRPTALRFPNDEIAERESSIPSDPR